MSHSETGERRLGIVGAGKLGTTIARAAIAAGYDVAMSGSGSAKRIALTVDVLAPGARAVETDEVVRHADLIVLAVPTHRFHELPRDLFAGKTPIDAMNYWEPIDGVDEEPRHRAPRNQCRRTRTFPVGASRQESQSARLPRVRRRQAPRGAAGRVALAAAGDDRVAVAAVIQLIDRLGFDAVDAGPLDAGLALEPDGPVFGISHSADELSHLLWHEASTA
jgi:8-hydroxy-5-deazaflavin:NADPH oxidoreductase